MKVGDDVGDRKACSSIPSWSFCPCELGCLSSLCLHDTVDAVVVEVRCWRGGKGEEFQPGGGERGRLVEWFAKSGV